MDKNFELSTDVNEFVDKFLELSPRYKTIKLYNDEIKNNPNLSPVEKMAFTIGRRKILKQAENLASTFNLADLELKTKGKSLESELPTLDKDWFNYFSDIVNNVSDKEMQAIWAKILTRECENKNSICKKLISILQIIEKNEAEVFSYVCAYSSKITLGNENWYIFYMNLII